MYELTASQFPVPPQVKDQQEAERKKVTSQEIQLALREQTGVIQTKQVDVKQDLDQVEPAVIEAQQGKSKQRKHQ